jgi:hypothetical protein
VVRPATSSPAAIDIVGGKKVEVHPHLVPYGKDEQTSQSRGAAVSILSDC